MAEENVLDLLVLLTPNMNRVRVITMDPMHSKFTMDPSMDLFTMDPIHSNPNPRQDAMASQMAEENVLPPRTTFVA
jgi:hypothetical protein